ncbi:MAG: hypothetical protein RLZZ158_2007 [Cyanobacteriota bacterium]|jgi:uncharacterized protein (TIGR03792 family)
MSALLALLLPLLLGLLTLGAPAWALRPLDPAAGVVEVLQMPVASTQQPCWRQAEEQIWEPWLEKQSGYRGRELLWDPERQQAVVLVGWASQAAWDAIPATSISRTEARFDGVLRRCLGNGASKPLPLQRTGSLQPLLANANANSTAMGSQNQ